MTPDPEEEAAIQAIRDALAVVRRYRLAEVEVVLSSDRHGVVRMRQLARLSPQDLREGVRGVD